MSVKRESKVLGLSEFAFKLEKDLVFYLIIIQVHLEEQNLSEDILKEPQSQPTSLQPEFIIFGKHPEREIQTHNLNIFLLKF